MHSIMQVDSSFQTTAKKTKKLFFSSYNRLLSVKEELEQKYLHLSQVYESEAKAKYQYLQQVEELSAEVRELRREVVHSDFPMNNVSTMFLFLSSAIH